ncbi:hypothetical protein ACFXKX_38930 [Streptomyces scopuliridis]
MPLSVPFTTAAASRFGSALLLQLTALRHGTESAPRATVNHRALPPW